MNEKQKSKAKFMGSLEQWREEIEQGIKPQRTNYLPIIFAHLLAFIGALVTVLIGFALLAGVLSLLYYIGRPHIILGVISKILSVAAMGALQAGFLAIIKMESDGDDNDRQQLSLYKYWLIAVYLIIVFAFVVGILMQ